MNKLNKPLRLVLLTGFASVLISCASHIAGECPETSGQRCITQKVCTHDAGKGCDMCYCDSFDSQHHLDDRKDPSDQQEAPYWQ